MERSAQTPTDHDDALLGDLRRLLGEIDPVPEHAQIAARAAIEWRMIDAELAALVHDSTIDDPVAAVRGGATTAPRALTFEAGDLTIEIEAEPGSGDEGMRLVGQLVPPQPAEVAVLHGEDLTVARADDRGRFVVGGISPGSVSVRCRLDDATGRSRLVETAWLEI